jgi:hypothetical protein
MRFASALIVLIIGGAAIVSFSFAQKEQTSAVRTGAQGDVTFDPVEKTLKIKFTNGKTFSFKAANNTTNPNGDPCKIGKHGPAPPGHWCLNPPCKADPGTPRYKRVGPAFFKLGSSDTIPYQRDVGLHAGSTSYEQLTFGCIRMTNHDLTELLDYLDSTQSVANTISLPGNVGCSQNENGNQAASAPPDCVSFMDDDITKQAAAAGIDYFKAKRGSENGNKDELSNMFKVTPYMDGEPAEEHGGNLYALLSSFGDPTFSEILSAETQVVRDQVIQSLDYAFNSQSPPSASFQSWAGTFPLTYRLGQHVGSAPRSGLR